MNSGTWRTSASSTWRSCDCGLRLELSASCIKAQASFAFMSEQLRDARSARALLCARRAATCSKFRRILTSIGITGQLMQLLCRESSKRRDALLCRIRDGARARWPSTGNYQARLIHRRVIFCELFEGNVSRSGNFCSNLGIGKRTPLSALRLYLHCV